MPSNQTFAPDYAIPPGDTLKEVLATKCISQSELACRTGLTEKTISQIVSATTPITYEVAAKFELALGVSARFWNNRESNYRESLVRIEEGKRLEGAIEWLKQIPVKALVERGKMTASKDKAVLVREALKFFGVSDIASWHKCWGEPCVQFRGGEPQQRRSGYVAAWLRLGELQAESIDVQPYDPAVFRAALIEMRRLTTRNVSEWAAEVAKVSASAGVVVVFTKEIDKAGARGATRWLSKDRAFIQLGQKFETDDRLIFTFFHEAGHVLLHSKKRVFVEFGIHADNNEEIEADKFARDLLIPQGHVSGLPFLRSRLQIQEFAKQLGIPAGVVVGRLEHDKFLQPAAFANLKRKINWATS